jgi:hypothetical protein
LRKLVRIRSVRLIRVLSYLSCVNVQIVYDPIKTACL